MTDIKKLDVIIIGGSYAGLSAAMSLGRSRRTVLIIDNGMPCNRQTPHSHNFITQDGMEPGKIAALAKEQVLKYPTVRFLHDLAVKVDRRENGFEITTQSGEKVEAKKLVFATGIKDSMPDIKGFAACWGISVVHCPYCHGYELRDKKTGIMANGERAFHLASLVHNLTDGLTILTAGKADFTPEQMASFNRHHINIIETELSEINHHSGHLQDVIFKDGSREAFEGIYAALPFMQHTDLPVQLGCELTEQGYIRVNDFQKTSVDGIFACGDNSSRMRSVANAVYTGSLTGAMVNMELTNEVF